MFETAKMEIKPVLENPLQAFYTDKFQLYDIIEVILSQLPYCKELTMTSFSISEEFTRKIYRFREQFFINEINLFLDTKAAAKVQKLNLFLKNNSLCNSLVPCKQQKNAEEITPLVPAVSTKPEIDGAIYF